MKSIITAGKGGKPAFDPGGLNSLSKLPQTPDSITDTAGITWTGPVINGRLDLEFAHYLDAVRTSARNPQPRARPLSADPVLDAHRRSRSSD